MDKSFLVLFFKKELLSCLFLLLFFGAAHSEDRVWRTGNVEAKADAGIELMPGQHDFAARHGLKIDYTQIKGDVLLTKALIAGELDSYESNPGGGIIAVGHGADIKLVGCYWPVLTYGLFTKEDINSLADLKGKNFAISGPGSLPDLTARALLEQAHIPVSDVRFAVLGSDADRFRALTAGIVQAAAFSVEFLPIMQAQHIKMLSNYAEALPDYPRVCTFISGKTLRERPADAAGFLAAEMTAFQYALDHKDETIALSQKLSGAKPDDPKAAAIFAQVEKYHAVIPTMPIPMEKLAWLQALLVKTKNLNEPYDLAKLTDPKPREAALKIDGLQ
jgi:NitT/TauT family transport system substrate-binding protein